MLGISAPQTDEEIQKYHFKRIIESSKKAKLFYKKTDDTRRSTGYFQAGFNYIHCFT